MKSLTEAIAASGALEFSLELGFHKAILEGDSMIVMAALRDPSPSLASFGLLIRDAQLMANLFTCISFQHVGRVGNNVAQNLASHWFFSLDRGCSYPNFCSLSGGFAYHLIKHFKFFFLKKKYFSSSS